MSHHFKIFLQIIHRMCLSSIEKVLCHCSTNKSTNPRMVFVFPLMRFRHIDIILIPAILHPTLAPNPTSHVSGDVSITPSITGYNFRIDGVAGWKCCITPSPHTPPDTSSPFADPRRCSFEIFAEFTQKTLTTATISSNTPRRSPDCALRSASHAPLRSSLEYPRR